MNGSSRILKHAVIATLAVSALPVAAQTSGGGRTIENIIVTAQKREQSLQDVPIVVTAVSEQLIRDTGIKDIKDLTILTPGLIVTSSSNESITTARIRGVGTVGDNPGLESSVGVVIDGVYRPRNGVSFGDLGELERIEVLKGPQGTLFGKNTSAGVINVISKRPTFDFDSNVALTAGNFGVLEAEASLNGPIMGDTLAGRIYIASRDREGFYDVSTGEGPRGVREDADRNMYTVRGQLLLQASDNFDARLVVDYSDREEVCCGSVKVLNGPTAPLVDLLSLDQGVSTGDPYEFNSFLNRINSQEITDRGVSLEMNWDMAGLGESTLTSVTAVRNWEIVSAQDVDYTSADILYRNPDGSTGTEFDQLSQELRLAGEAGKVNWLVGAFFANEDLSLRQQLVTGADMQEFISRRFAPAGNANPAGWLASVTGGAPIYANGQPYQNDRHEQESESYALFTNNSIAFTEQLELTLGLRYTQEKKELTTLYNNANSGIACTRLMQNLATIAAQPISGGGIGTMFATICATGADPVYNNLPNFQDSIDESETSGTAKLAYRFTDELMTYLSYARGYKASGYNMDRVRRAPGFPSPASGLAVFGVGNPNLNTSFPAEIADSYEVGAKTDWFDGALLVNGAVFYQIFENFQLNTFTGINFIVESVEEVTSQGVDLDFLWRAPVAGLSFQGGVTYAETEYTKPPLTANVLSLARLNDRVSFAPLWSGSLSATYEIPIGADLKIRTNLGGKYTSSYNTGSNLAPQKVQDAYTVLNARLGVAAADNKWAVELWSQNVTDEEYVQIIFDSVLQTGSFDAYLGAPRTYGVTARFNF